ncbi:heterokaryon incompatibility protein-domain-containing protein [Microdochium bolleyi]|uniref:Heterokaryon incompatibility protein-domain-containing protein n=1 Tax=Microdochium bolleyi TaxID=196109 RepID=A0A136ITI4_9PEZI|nr:heterokaryon incompatibility protein-domain-containing protein [Microdochium bolleyi]
MTRRRRRHSSPAFVREPKRPRIANSTKPYQYSPLPAATSLRILRLDPGQVEDVVSCRLEVVDRAQAPPYEAISYVWGSPTDTRLVLCSGRKIRVPTSLRDILHSLRSPEHTLTLWADAICINQQDDAEKGHQVKLMGTIFASATRVLVWLGKEALGAPTEYGLDVDGETSWGMDREEIPLCDMVVDTQLRLTRLLSYMELKLFEFGYSSLLEDEDFVDSWTSLSKLYRRDWFHRLWVVQEVGLAQSAIAIFGRAAVEFSFLLDFSRRLERHVLLRSHFQFPNYLATAFEIFPSSRSDMECQTADLQFLDILEITQEQGATDGRDRIYALLSHPSAVLSDGQLIIEPDYTKTTQEVYHEIAIKIIEETKSLRILATISPGEDHLDDDFLPSWVPNWEASELKSNGFRSELSTTYRTTAVNHVPPAEWRFSPGKKNSIQVRGYIIDVVDEHTTTMDIYDKYAPFEPKRNDPGAWPLGHAFAFRSRLDIALERRIADLCCALTVNYEREPDTEELADFAEFRCILIQPSPALEEAGGSHPIAPEGIAELLTLSEKATLGRFIELEVKANCQNRKLFSTTMGCLGLGPHLVQNGDLCCVIHGCHIPLVLRRAERGFRVLGPAYIHGFIIGDSKPVDGSETFVDQDFVLY